MDMRYEGMSNGSKWCTVKTLEEALAVIEALPQAWPHPTDWRFPEPPAKTSFDPTIQLASGLKPKTMAVGIQVTGKQVVLVLPTELDPLFASVTNKALGLL